MSDPLVTATQLHAIMPLAGARADVFAPILSDVMLFRQINTPARAAAFLAQVGHESGQVRYEGRADLGNAQPGDGKRFMGRGLIQITGRKNYADCGAALGLDLITQPELLEKPQNAAASAAWFWVQHNLNRFADRGDFVGLTRAINGGTNGIADRRALWERAKAALKG
jgi:putative chitinase